MLTDFPRLPVNLLNWATCKKKVDTISVATSYTILLYFYLHVYLYIHLICIVLHDIRSICFILYTDMYTNKFA